MSDGRKTVKEYMYAGLTQSLSFYLASAGIMLLLSGKNGHVYSCA